MTQTAYLEEGNDDTWWCFSKISGMGSATGVGATQEGAKADLISAIGYLAEDYQLRGLPVPEALAKDIVFEMYVGSELEKADLLESKRSPK